MVIWVKEFSDFRIESLSAWLKKSVKLKKFSGFEYIDETDFIVISNKDTKVDKDIHNDYNIVVFEEIVDEVSIQIMNYVNYNFDYYYIRKSFKLAETSNIENIITGSSYGRLDVNEKDIPNAINLSLESQDMYYSLQGIKKVCDKSNKIRNIIICCGYYYFFSDMSKSKNFNSIKNISNVYMTLFGNEAYHNCLTVIEQNNILDNPIFDVNKIVDTYSDYEYDRGYYNKDDRLRIKKAVYGVNWLKTSDSDRDNLGRKRAELHNKNINRRKTYKENLNYFKELAALCRSNNINLMFVVTPATESYRKYLEPEFKKVFYDTLNIINSEIHLLDLFDNDIFVTEDFIDTDHLSDSGADKMTMLINEALETM